VIEPSIVFCTTVKNRAQHLCETLPQNLADNPKSKFVVLDYNTDDNLFEYVFTEHMGDIESGRLVVYSCLTEPKFRMAHAKNMAHRLGIREGGDILVNQDADNLTGPGFEDFITEAFGRSRDIFLWANVTHGVHLKSGTRVVRGLSGRLVVTKQAFFKTGGYDEKFNGWSPDDKDFNLRLRMLGYEAVEIEAPYLLGVPHNEKIRFKEYPHLQDASEDYFAAVNKVTVDRAIVNRGDFGCGTVYRNGDFTRPIHLDRLPTKIFGIGMHKTATTSLHHALEILGYESWHWTSAHAAKAIWQQMNNEGYSSILDRYHAACDLPIPRLYRQLDDAYPGSKFILTLRDEQSWLDAVRRHFDPDKNPWRRGWDDDPFSNRIHELIYRRTDFDADVFLARYRRHNQEVRDYFRHRPEDLFVMHMKHNPGWADLCGFLNISVPDVPYPHAHMDNGAAI
jgi:Sulfotransferase domain/N-terminal domain of galactosyltransferase